MARTRKVFGPLFYGTLIVGACVLFLVSVLEWSTAGPATPRVDFEPTVRALIPEVTTGDPGSRIAAIHALEEALPGFSPVGDASGTYGRALAALRSALRNPNASVRAASADTLGSLGPWARPAVDELNAVLKADDPDLRNAAAQALLKIGGEVQEPALRVLAGVVADPEPIPDRTVFVKAMLLAGEPGQDAAARALASLLANKDDAVRSDAVLCVSVLGPGASRMLPALEPLLKDPALRYTAALAAIQSVGAESNPDPRLVTILTAAVSDASLSLKERQNALSALYPLGTQGIWSSSMAAFSNVYPAGSPTPSALRRCGLDLARQLEHKDADVRLAAATLLHMIDPETLAGKAETTGSDQP